MSLPNIVSIRKRKWIATLAVPLVMAGAADVAFALAPSVPTDLHGRPAGTDVIHVVCDPVTDPEGDAVEYRFHDITLGTRSAWISEPLWIDRQLDTGSTHEYYVEARDTGGLTSGSSATTLVRTFDAPLEGFGSEGGTDGGLFAPHYRVTSLADTDTPGTLRYALLRGNYYITFDVAGTIDMENRIRIIEENLTIDGFSAPAPGITMIPNTSPVELGIVIDVDRNDPAGRRGNNIIIRGLRIVDGLRDNFAVGGADTFADPDMAAHHIIVDHCSFHSGVDGNGDIGDGAHHVTFQYCILGGPIGSKNQLIGSSPNDYVSSVSIHHNLYARSDSRNPQIQGRTEMIDVINNIYLDWDGYAIRSQCHTEYGPPCDDLRTKVNIIGNYFMQASSAPDNAILFDEEDGTETLAYTEGNRCITGIVNEDGQSDRWPGSPISEEFAGPDLVTNSMAHIGAPFRTAEEQEWVEACVDRLSDISPPDSTPPGAPGRPTVPIGESYEDKLRWVWGRPVDDVTDGPDHWFKFYWSTVDDFATADSTYWRIQDNYNLVGLDGETTIYAWIRGRDLAGNWGPISDVGTATTLPSTGDDDPGDDPVDDDPPFEDQGEDGDEEEGGDDPLPPDVLPPLPPTYVLSTYSTAGMRVEWDESPSPNASGYRVYREEEGKSGRQPVSQVIEGTEFVDTSVVEGTAYFYRVSVVDDDGIDSGTSEAVWARAIPAPPMALMIDRVYPHPVRGQATFRFLIPEVGPGHPDGVRVTVDLYNTAGRRVSRVVDDVYAPGVREVQWAPGAGGSRLSPGLYTTVIRAANQVSKSQVAIRR